MAAARVYESRRHAGSLRAPASESVGVGGVAALVEDAGVALLFDMRAESLTALTNRS
jgi:hypothetical protein